jgi:hypothetical protein
MWDSGAHEAHSLGDKGLHTPGRNRSQYPGRGLRMLHCWLRTLHHLAVQGSRKQFHERAAGYPYDSSRGKAARRGSSRELERMLKYGVWMHSTPNTSRINWLTILSGALNNRSIWSKINARWSKSSERRNSRERINQLSQLSQRSRKTHPIRISQRSQIIQRNRITRRKQRDRIIRRNRFNPRILNNRMSGKGRIRRLPLYTYYYR